MRGEGAGVGRLGIGRARFRDGQETRPEKRGFEVESRTRPAAQTTTDVCAVALNSSALAGRWKNILIGFEISPSEPARVRELLPAILQDSSPSVRQRLQG